MSAAMKLPPEQPRTPGRPAAVIKKPVFNTAKVEKHVPATTGKRIIALIIDGVVIKIASDLAMAFIVPILTTEPIMQKVASFLITFALMPTFYWAYLTYSMGGTPGKKMMGLEVISSDKSQLTFGRVFYRETLGRTVSLLCIGLGYITAFFDDRKMGWHDKMARTRVVLK